MSSAIRPPPRGPRTAASACLSSHGSVRLVARRHCLYRVAQQTHRAVVWCRPVSPEALAWMQARGVDAERVVCGLVEADNWIAAQEKAIWAASGPKKSNALPLPAAFGKTYAPSFFAPRPVDAFDPP